MRWEITPDGIEALRTDKKFAKLTDDQQELILKRFADLTGPIPGEALIETTSSAMKEAGTKGQPLQPAIVGAFAVKDPDAPVVIEKRATPSPTPTCETTKTYQSR